MKRLLALIFCALFFAGCARGCEGCKRSVQVTDRNYHIKQYSGGVLIGEYKFRGILNNQESSDGFYFYQSDTLIEVSGDLEIKSW